MLELAHNVQRLYGLRRDFVCVTLVQIKGSAPQEEGAKMLVTTDGLYWGTVGGGKIEGHAITYAQELLSGGKESHARHWNLQKDIGMSCGGEVTLFFDVNRPMNWNLAVFGAGHVAQELCRILSTWSCHVSVFDNRAEWLERMQNSLNISKVLSPSL